MRLKNLIPLVLSIEFLSLKGFSRMARLKKEDMKSKIFDTGSL